MKKRIYILFLLFVFAINFNEINGSITPYAANKEINRHIESFASYLKENSKGNNLSVDEIIENFYKNSKKIKLNNEIVNKTTLPKNIISKQIHIKNSDITIYSDGTFSVETLSSVTDNSRLDMRSSTKSKTVTNNWVYRAVLGNKLITHKFSAKFKYDGKKAWYVGGSAKGNAYAHYIMSIESKSIDGWTTAAKSRTARMYVVACQNYSGFRINYMHTDTRIGVTKSGKEYKSTKQGGGI
ncbi:hypothetical protein OKW22_001383 [Bacilli bacterium PM5-3]|nr:hypothetical protein [Bacilli bacterium PM5-3]MDH6603514.1 hypothetical protein [Bacilli bacterium PM5-9]